MTAIRAIKTNEAHLHEVARTFAAAVKDWAAEVIVKRRTIMALNSPSGREFAAAATSTAALRLVQSSRPGVRGEPIMPTYRPAGLDRYRETYRSARARLKQHIGELAHARGLAIGVELGPIWAQLIIPDFHTITLRHQSDEAVLYIDPRSFIDSEEFFRAVVLPQISAAINKLVPERRTLQRARG